MRMIIKFGVYIMKKCLVLLTVLVIAVSFCGCKGNDTVETGKISIITTVFPMYDFAQNIAGDKAEVTLILPMGAEAHSYEPTVRDVMKIQQCDLFIRLGEAAEPWTENILEDKNKNGYVISAMDYADLKKVYHNHQDAYEYDQHIWTSLKNSIKTITAISKMLCEIDEKNSEYYKKNASDYIAKIDSLDTKFEKLTENSSKKLIFADRFPFRYFVEDYGLDYFAAYPGCSDESEPSAAAVAQLMATVKSDNTDIIFYTETSDGKLPDTVSKETGAKKMLFHSCHTLTNEDVKEGKNYLSLMEDNYKALEAYLK